MADDPTAGPTKDPPDPTPRQPPLTNAEVEAVIDGFIRLQVALIPSRHFRKRGAARHVSVSDATWVLTNGQVLGNPEWNEAYGDWAYAVRGEDVEGEVLELRIGIEPDRAAIVLITVYEPN
jgi:hypothetical protein